MPAPPSASKRDWVKIALTAFFAVSVIAGIVVPRFRPTVVQRNQQSDPAIRRQLFDLLQPIALSNCRLERFGEAHDGGYLVCANLLSGVGGGYSYGISGYDGWGCDVSSRLGVPVHQYDCFDTRAPNCPKGKTVFHPECVAEANKTEEGRVFGTMQDQFARNGDAGKRLIVKMDVEGAEWQSFLNAPDSVFEAIDQLIVEFHFVDEPDYVAAVRRLKQFFHIAHLHFNNYSCASGMDPFPAWAYEVLFVSKRLGTADESRAVTLPSPLDTPNAPQQPDCQLYR